MPTDNLEVFKRVIFHIPPLKKTLTLFGLLGVAYSISLFFLVNQLLIDSINFLSIPLFTLLLFLLPGLAASEVYYFFLPGYPRKWGYFLSLVNQLVIFLFAVLLTFSDDFAIAWKIIWLGLITLYINNFFILVLSVGPSYLRRISLLSLVQPLMILGAFHFVLGRFLQIGYLAYFTNFLVVFGAGLVLLLSVYVTEFLVGSNVSNISILNLAAALLQNKQEKLDLGRKVSPDVQTLEIENRSGSKKFVVPWLHPGPLEGFGGGQITSRIIKALNRDEREGFFLHVPSNHEMDPSDPEDSKKVVKAVSEPEKYSEASRLVRESYEDIVFYGRKIGEKKIVYMDHQGFDDYDSSIFEEVLDKGETVLIDLHNQPKGSRLGEMRYGTEEAEKVREYLNEFMEFLDKQETEDYAAGFSVNQGSKPSSALVEKVGDQKTLMFGIEGNDSSEELLELREEFSKSFDEVLLFTTDTHASIHDLASDKQVKKDEIRETVEGALRNLSPASAGVSLNKSEPMKFLKDDYYGLIFTINILVRLIPISLVVMYLALVIWLL
ncbi:MAG: DUF2070 family protein [Candidatus Nanosalina sp.]